MLCFAASKILLELPEPIGLLFLFFVLFLLSNKALEVKKTEAITFFFCWTKICLSSASWRSFLRVSNCSLRSSELEINQR